MRAASLQMQGADMQRRTQPNCLVAVSACLFAQVWGVPGFAQSSVYESQILRAPIGAPFDWFGSSVAINATTIAVGAFGDDVLPLVNTGSVYIFAFDGAEWNYEQTIAPPTRHSDQYFGRCVAMSGDVLLVGAFRETDAGLMNKGAAYIFRRAGSGAYVYEARLASAEPIVGGFGYSCALSGRLAALGADQASFGLANSGSAWVFESDGNQSWAQVAHLIPQDVGQGDLFGFDVAWVQSRLVASSPYRGPGRFHVASNVGATWELSPPQNNPAPVADDVFGRRIASFGSMLAVGVGGGTGRVEIYSEQGGTLSRWYSLAPMVPSNGFGQDVALAHDNICLVGEQNQAAIYTLGATEARRLATMLASDAVPGHGFGRALAIDRGFVVAGAEYWESAVAGSAVDEGAVYVYDARQITDLLKDGFEAPAAF